MPGSALQNIGLIEGWTDLEDNWGAAMNANLRALDVLVQARVLDKDLSAPPGSPAAGDTYIVAGSPSGAWTGHAGKIARWSGTVWEFVTPKAGWFVWVADEAIHYDYTGSAWTAFTVANVLGLQAALDAKANTLVAINSQSGTSYTLALTDSTSVVRFSNSGAITATVPTNASVAFPIGSVVTLRQAGDGTVQISPAGGVTVNTPLSRLSLTRARGAVVMLHKVGTNEWDLSGDLQTA